MSDKKDKQEYEFGGIKTYSLEEIENIILNDSEYLDVFAGSDLRFKENIQPLDHSLENLVKLQTIKYDYKKEFQVSKGLSEHRQIGLLAQELSTNFPETVKKDKDGHLMVNYQGLIPALVDSIKELNSKVQELEKKLEDKKG